MSDATSPSSLTARTRVLVLSTAAFTLLFTVWLMLGVLGIPIRKEFALSDSQLEWLIATAILTGAIFRLNFGIWADQFGGRNVFIALLLGCAAPTYYLSRATTYGELLVCALGFGMAGNSFSAGIAWCSAWYPNHLKGTALGLFGAGNAGAAGTKMLVVLVPGVLSLVPAAGWLGGFIPGGWRAVPAFYAVLLVAMAAAIYFFSPTPDPKPGRSRSLRDTLEPLKHMRVWRFGLYYVVVFGAYVALSGWLPKFYVDTYSLSLHDAALLTALFIFPASLLRPVGGYLSDRFGPRVVTYGVFATMIVALCALSVPNGTHFGMSYHLDVTTFATLLFVVACGMGIGKASVYKYIPNYFPNDIGAVGGLVGALGALGGFFLPPVFGKLGRLTGVPQSAFLALAALTFVCGAWLHWTVARLRAAERSHVALSKGIEAS
jgi:NNP family nitrate/nitrite transporter-like MFS transporter